MDSDLTYQQFSQGQLDLFPHHAAVDTPQVCLGDVEALTALCASGARFGTVYADPPWPYGNTSTRAAAHRNYATLSLAELARLPVRQLAMPSAHLYLWVTNSFIEEGLQLMRAWGFRYVSKRTWCKTQIGLGNYFRNATEDVLLGVRGQCPFRDKSQSTWFLSGRGQHSRKPDLVRQCIERASPGPYLELFGREAVDGWTVWGNQITPTLFAQAGD